MKHAEGRILLVEDDAAIRRSIRIVLDSLGFAIGEARTGEEALAQLRGAAYETVLLDINMPGIGGVECCRRIRRGYPRLPVIVLTVRDSEDDQVEALEAGCDDFITKPFPMRLLIARLRAAVRRFRDPSKSPERPLVIGKVMLDRARRRMELSGEATALTPREFDALRLLMEHAGRPVTHARLLTALRGPEFANGREYLRVLIRQLRKKLEEDPAHPQYLLTESYVGYRFREE